MILILACRPIRRRNVAAMEIGRHLVRRGDAYALAFDGAETKNRRRFEQPLDPALTRFIDRYLSYYRPQLLGRSESERVWISRRGKPISDFAVYSSITARTRAAFGFAMPPHRFRDSAVTTLV